VLRGIQPNISHGKLGILICSLLSKQHTGNRFNSGICRRSTVDIQRFCLSTLARHEHLRSARNLRNYCNRKDYYVTLL